MNEIDLTFVWRLLLTVAAIAAFFIIKGDVWPWLRNVMSRRRERLAAADRSANQYVYQSAPTSMAGHTTPAASNMVPDHNSTAPADIDAENAGMDWQPRLSRYPDERELIVYLATIRHKNGKYQKSANQIAAFVGGDRNAVLRIIREVREGVPEYPHPLTEEQRAVREELALEG